MYTVHRNRTHSKRYIRSEYCSQKQNTFQTELQKCVLCTETKRSVRYTRNVYCEMKQKIFQTVYQICVLCTETEHFPNVNQKFVQCIETEVFPNGTSEMCTVHRNRTISKRYIRNVYCARKQNNLQTLNRYLYFE
jgi:hypothetical protein